MTIARDIFLNNDGTKLYIAGQASEKVVDYTLSPAYILVISSGNLTTRLAFQLKKILALALPLIQLVNTCTSQELYA